MRDSEDEEGLAKYNRVHSAQGIQNEFDDEFDLAQGQEELENLEEHENMSEHQQQKHQHHQQHQQNYGQYGEEQFEEDEEEDLEDEAQHSHRISQAEHIKDEAIISGKSSI